VALAALAVVVALIALELPRFWVRFRRQPMLPTALDNGQCSQRKLLARISR
jgi:hypothetical protein